MKYLPALLAFLLGCEDHHPTAIPAPAPAPVVVYFGDSITDNAFQGFPTNWGCSGFSASTAAIILAKILRDFPDASIVTLAFGTNDAYYATPPATFEAQLSALVDQVQASGRRAMIPTIPYSTTLSGIPALNVSISNVVAAKACPPAPNLYAWFLANPGELGPDGIHPNATGSASLRKLWADAIAVLP